MELFNPTADAVDLGGWFLTDAFFTSKKFRIPDGTWLGPTSYVSYTETTLGFALSSAGEEIYLVNSNQARVLDAIRFAERGYLLDPCDQPGMCDVGRDRPCVDRSGA